MLGNEEKLKAHSYRALPDFGVNDTEKARVNDIFSVRETAGHMVDAIEGRARAFVQVQNGCDHRCTFCIIPYGRGNSRSVPMGAVVEQVKRLAGNGYAEIVLTGVDMTSFRRRPAGRAEARQTGEDHPQAGARREAPAAVLHRFDRGRRRSARRHRHRAAADAASASVAAIRRRHDPEAHEAPASARPVDPLLRGCAQAAPGNRLRRRHHRRLPDRDRGDVREFGKDRRGMRPDASARLPVFSRAKARPPRACRRSAAKWSSSAPPGCAPPAKPPIGAIWSSLAGTRQSILVERDGLGRTEGFTLAALGAGAPGEIVEADDHRP